MTDRFATFSAPNSYWQASRAPRYSLLFALPLLAFYQILAVLLSTGPRSIRNGADVILQGLFVAVAGRWGPLLFMICLIGGGLWLVARDIRAHGSRLRGRVFLGMLGESLALALAFGIVVGGITSGVIGLLQTLALASPGDLTWWTRLMVSLGAGIYEELLFRVLLVTALAATARALFGWTPVAAGVAATVLGAAIFSAFHYLGPYGDRLQVYSFVFRMIAGLFFSALYLLRGFGITAWTHALYDVSLLLLS
ncbi:MAG: CPBP family intramembrane metalloprotease [Gemmatimonadetes bacterium]|nr:MAG: CPBP family intramembrane metalloprotease [Gemmatimonadota bacterium]